MPVIYVLDGEEVGRQVPIEGAAVLGRSPDCDVQLHGNSVSRRHACLEREGGRWYVVDLGARNGVSVGGQRVERAELIDGDEFLLGRLPLRFRLDESAREAGAPAELDAAAPPDEIELEEEIELEREDSDPDLAVTRLQPRPAPRAPLPPARRPDPPPGPPARPVVPDLRAEERAELLRRMAAQRRGGIFSGDLAQQPFWVRLAVGVLVTALFVGVCAAAYLGVRSLRGG